MLSTMIHRSADVVPGGTSKAYSMKNRGRRKAGATACTEESARFAGKQNKRPVSEGAASDPEPQHSVFDQSGDEAFDPVALLADEDE